ncbi:unnamed protein product [Oikopleura dioica]|uniref:Uncharacterized protein n=1 Tax=Oikopleura dioica TaxID=34765 RepID=E4XB54_OIKDI|nr:unnamed protein product [Oikopleura dioica]CBY43677.1 unnamed protein product [Oikopleura dioica]
MRMSNYGRESPSPGTKMGQWTEYCTREERITKNIAMKNGQKNGTWLDDEEIKAQNEGAFKNAYYEFDTSTHSRKNIDNRQYDRIFNADCNYDPKLHRDDRSNAKSRGLDVVNEETRRVTPLLSNAQYGGRPPLEIPDGKHRRVAVVKGEFFSNSRISLGQNKD